MAMEFTQWQRAHPDGTRDQWKGYLHELAERAREANESTLPRNPEDVIAHALLEDDRAEMTVQEAAGFITLQLDAAGYAVVDVSPSGPGHYTRDQVSAAVNGGADLLPDHEYENEDTIAQDDVVNLVVNAALYLLDHPGADVNEVIAAQYTDVEVDDSDLDEGEGLPDKGSPRWNELVTTRVLGWLP
jgi:hypothetical protein